MIQKIILRFIYSLIFLLLVSCTNTNYSPFDPDQNFSNGEDSASSYHVSGKHYSVLKSNANYEEKGLASWYGSRFHRKRTSSGERYNMYRLTAAHKTLPLSSYALVTNLVNGRQVVVKVNDRGPFVSNRLIDLSYAAAKKIGIINLGTAPVSVKAINKSINV